MTGVSERVFSMCVGIGPFPFRHSREACPRENGERESKPRHCAVPCVPRIPAPADVLLAVEAWDAGVWIPAFAGMTGEGRE